MSEDVRPYPLKVVRPAAGVLSTGRSIWNAACRPSLVSGGHHRQFRWQHPAGGRSRLDPDTGIHQVGGAPRRAGTQNPCATLEARSRAGRQHLDPDLHVTRSGGSGEDEDEDKAAQFEPAWSGRARKVSACRPRVEAGQPQRSRHPRLCQKLRRAVRRSARLTRRGWAPDQAALAPCRCDATGVWTGVQGGAVGRLEQPSQVGSWPDATRIFRSLTSSAPSGRCD